MLKLVGVFYSSGSPILLKGSLGVPESLSGNLQSQNHYHNDTKTFFAFSTVILS